MNKAIEDNQKKTLHDVWDKIADIVKEVAADFGAFIRDYSAEQMGMGLMAFMQAFWRAYGDRLKMAMGNLVEAALAAIGIVLRYIGVNRLQIVAD